MVEGAIAGSTTDHGTYNGDCTTVAPIPAKGNGQTMVVEDQTNHRSRSRSLLLGSLLAVLSGILFTANNFLVKYYTIEAVDMLMVRSCLQTLLTALLISKKTSDISQLILSSQSGPSGPSSRTRGWTWCW